MSKDNTELEEQLDRRRVSFGLWKIVSDMLDNPGEHGIYPTSECYDRLDEKAQALITEKMVKLANLYGEPRCGNLHHAKKNQHTSIEDCPVEKAINEQLKKNK